MVMLLTVLPPEKIGISKKDSFDNLNVLKPCTLLIILNTSIIL